MSGEEWGTFLKKKRLLGRRTISLASKRKGRERGGCIRERDQKREKIKNPFHIGRGGGLEDWFRREGKNQ